jgi:hypothetical protein
LLKSYASTREKKTHVLVFPRTTRSGMLSETKSSSVGPLERDSENEAFADEEPGSVARLRTCKAVMGLQLRIPRRKEAITGLLATEASSARTRGDSL